LENKNGKNKIWIQQLILTPVVFIKLTLLMDIIWAVFAWIQQLFFLIIQGPVIQQPIQIEKLIQQDGL